MCPAVTAPEADIMAAVMRPLTTFGDARSRDVYHRHSYQVSAASSAATPVTVDHNFYGLTAATGSSHGAESQFELVKMSAVEAAADGFAGRLDITVNDGTDATAAVKVAELSADNAKFVAKTLSADFGSSYSTALTKGVGQDGTTAAAVQTFNTGASGTAVQLAATSDRLYVKAADTDVSGKMTLQGDQLSWYQKGGTAGVKVSAANEKYVYTHNAGTAGTSTGVRQFNLDGFNVDNLAMASGAFAFNGFNDTGAAEPLLNMGSGKAAGTQDVQFSNSFIGVNQAPSATERLAVTGDVKVTGSQSVTGDLNAQNIVCRGDFTVDGVTTTVNSVEVTIQDKNIVLAEGTTTASLLDGAGLTIGSGQLGVGQFTFNYADALAAWQSSISLDLVTGKSYTLDSGANTSTDSGATLSASGLYFGADTTQIQLGTAVDLKSDELRFASDDAKIYFGTAAVIDKTGLSGSSDDFAAYFGSLRQWQIKRQVIGSDDFLTMSWCADGTVASPVYDTKFSIMA